MAFSGIGPKIFGLAPSPVHDSRRAPAKRRVLAGAGEGGHAQAGGGLGGGAAGCPSVSPVEQFVDSVRVHTFLKHAAGLGLEVSGGQIRLRLCCGRQQ